MKSFSILDRLLGKVDREAYDRIQQELAGQMFALEKGAIVSETDAKGRITYVNDAFRDLTGYHPNEILGKTHKVLQSGLHSHEFYNKLWQTISDGQVWKGVIVNKTQNDNLFWTQTTIVPIKSEKGLIQKYIAIRFDITEQIKLQKELEEKVRLLEEQDKEIRQLYEEVSSTNEELSITNEQLVSIQKELEAQLEGLNQAVIVSMADIRGNITYVNDYFCKVSKYTCEELMGKNHRIVRHPDMPAQVFEEMWRDISSGKIWRGIVKNKAKDGSVYWVDTTIVPILDEKGIPQKYLSVRVDITAQKLAEEQVQYQSQTIDSLNSSLLMAKQALEKKLEDIEFEFMHSLNYAQRIQRALMPTPQEMKNYMPNDYEIEILFCPKEKVSGDFYWGTQFHNRTLIFLGDATGHGVAGSFMTIMAAQALNYLVNEKMILLPDILLDELSKIIVKQLRQEENHEHTVLDSIEGYALLIENDTITISAANRCYFIVKANGDLQDCNGSKKHIGGKDYFGDSAFTKSTFSLEPGDTLYLCTDGIETQLGGHSSNQKFGKTQLKELLSQFHTVLSLSKRSQLLYKRVNEWRGFFNEQNDDFSCLMIRKK